ncbi:unnamed protein product [Orchesella dallaii]|uniref:Uncharacterized protein n=1 Tax=Orchesella dallaii TaxID=48710 RepID=A0ABP1PJ83_9HEXA
MEFTPIESHPFSFIYSCIKEESAYKLSKWESISKWLLPSSKINEIAETVRPIDARKRYYKTFEVWRIFQDQNATLQWLVDVLETENLPCAAKSIREQYKNVWRKTRTPFKSGLRVNYNSTKVF